MKKIKFLSVMIIGIFLSVFSVDAQNNFTAEDIMNKVKEGETYALLNKNGAITMGVTSTGFSINTNADGTNYVTDFRLENGLLSYELEEGLEETTLVMQSSMDATWIGEVSTAVALLNGYSKDFLSSMDETALTFDKNGIEYTTKTFETFGLPYTVIKTMKMDVNNLRFDTSSTEPTPSPTPTPEPDDPVEDNKNLPHLGLASLASSDVYLTITNV